jgi:hypothetical protein
MRMIELSARRHCQQSAEGDGKKGRWVHQHANGPSSWRRDARHFGSTQPRLLMRNCGIGFNLAQILTVFRNPAKLGVFSIKDGALVSSLGGVRSSLSRIHSDLDVILKHANASPGRSRQGRTSHFARAETVSGPRHR